jgi:(p)ppGpp synthase/HD superfamily hydrolase
MTMENDYNNFKTKDMVTLDINKIMEFARQAHRAANCSYDGQDYGLHLGLVEDAVDMHNHVFKTRDDYIITRAAASYHDAIEDAKLSYNDIRNATNEDVADVVLAVTDVHEKNRLMRHLMTMGKTVKNYRAIVLKLCDIKANAGFSKKTGSSMYRKYVEEYAYRKPIFKKALMWYTPYLNIDELDKLWAELDDIHNSNVK